MSTRAMKGLLSALGKEAGKTLTRPADPKVVMQEFCQAMSVRTGRPIQLVFRVFPPDIPVTGMRLDFGSSSVIVVEERAVPASQLVILGHELYHEEQGDCGHGSIPAAARSLTADQAPDLLQRAAEQILASQEVPREALMALAARADSEDPHEVDAETFGLLFGHEARKWIVGPHARGPVTSSTVEGRIELSMTTQRGAL